ncbi:MAG: hypothetical protein AAF657_20345 [Acidobacteriota bacterium]
MKKLIIPILSALLLLAFAWIGPDAPADDPAQEGETPQASSEPPAEASEEADDPEADEEIEPAKALETFVPTEKLPADSAISFPTDI